MSGIVVIGAVFVDIKGYPSGRYIPDGRNVGRIEQVHGGVSRNVAENIANVELKPTFVSLVDTTGSGNDVINRLNNHKVNTKFMRKIPEGMGIWLAIFDRTGDVIGSISQRPDLSPIADILEEHGDEIFSECDSIVVEIDMDSKIVKKILSYARKYNKNVYAVVSNMSIAIERRDFIQQTACFICNQQEAGMFFSDDFSTKTAEEMQHILLDKIQKAKISKMVVTMGGKGAVYADINGETGVVPALNVNVIDTTGAGDAFFSGVTIGLTYNQTLKHSCEIGARLAASVICTTDSVCPRFQPTEFGINR